MSIRLGVPKEIEQGERRVALVPAMAERFIKLGVEVLLETGAGDGSHQPDASYKGVTIVPDAASLYQQADVILKVQPPGEAEIDRMKAGAVVVGMMLAHRYPERVARLKVTFNSPEMLAYVQAQADGDNVASFAVQLRSTVSCSSGVVSLVLDSAEDTAGVAPDLQLEDPNAITLSTFEDSTSSPATFVLIAGALVALAAGAGLLYTRRNRLAS